MSFKVADHTGRSPLYQGFQECCRKVLSSGQTSGNMSFAKSYAQAGLHLSTTAGIRTQASYLVANLSGWRDPDAKEVRAALRQMEQGQVCRPNLARKLDNPSKDLSSLGDILEKRQKELLELKDLEE